MKFLLITIFFSLTVFTAFSQDSINRIYYSNGSLRSFQIEKDSIFIYEKSFYENGEVAGEGVGRIKNGKFVPLNFKRFYDTGELWYSINDSLHVSFEKDGSLYMKTEMCSGEKNGIMEYYADGKLIYSAEYKNDLKNGKTAGYKQDGGYFEILYNKNKMNGPAKYFAKTGILEKELYYADDCIIKAVYFDSKGRVLRTITSKKELILTEGKSIDCRL